MRFYVYVSAMCPHCFRHHCLRRRHFRHCRCRLPSLLHRHAVVLEAEIVGLELPDTLPLPAVVSGGQRRWQRRRAAPLKV